RRSLVATTMLGWMALTQTVAIFIAGVLPFKFNVLSARPLAGILQQLDRIPAPPAGIPPQALTTPTNRLFPDVKAHVSYAMLDPGPGQGAPAGGIGTNIRARDLYGETNRSFISGTPIDHVLLGDQISVYQNQGGRSFATPLGRRRQTDSRLS